MKFLQIATILAVASSETVAVKLHQHHTHHEDSKMMSSAEAQAKLDAAIEELQRESEEFDFGDIKNFKGMVNDGWNKLKGLFH